MLPCLTCAGQARLWVSCALGKKPRPPRGVARRRCPLRARRRRPRPRRRCWGAWKNRPAANRRVLTMGKAGAGRGCAQGGRGARHGEPAPLALARVAEGGERADDSRRGTALPWARSGGPPSAAEPGKVYYRRGDLGARDMMRGLDGRGQPPPELRRPARSGPAPAPGCVARWRATAGRMRRAPASIKRAGCLAARIDGCLAARSPSPGRRGGRWGAARVGESPAYSAPPGAPGGRRRQKRACGGEAFPPLPAAEAPETPDARRGRRRGAGGIAAARPGGLDD